MPRRFLPPPPPEKKSKKDKLPAKVKKSVETTSTDSKIPQLDEKWSELFNRLEALLLSKSFQLTFSSEVHVTPTHSPSSGIAKDSEPFFQPTNRPVDISPVKRTGPDTDAALQWSAGKLHSDKDTQEQVSSEPSGPDAHASQHQSAGKLKSDSHRPRPSSSRRTGSDIVAKHQSTGKPVSDRHPPDSLPSDSDPAVPRHHSARKLSTYRPSSHRPRTDRPGSSGVTGSESPPLQASRRDSISSLESQADSDFLFRPPVELFVEEGKLSEVRFGESEQPTSEEQTYRETMSGIRSFMGWSHVPDVDSSNPSDDNPFAGPRLRSLTKCRFICPPRSDCVKS